ncbi:MAG: hypothetical protein JSV22_01250 [Bacteroidales bacterium]|nr:MAG: hypothetical protein JSV22_01250 [Bacteroidales bacterium]
MKKIILLSIAFLFALSVIAQSPHMFNYQAVVRSPTGDLLTNQNVSFEIVILQSSPLGAPVYTETHNATTNEYGLVTLKIGEGVTSDDLSTIDWGADKYFIQVSLDEEGGTNYQLMGTTQLLSVPYSLYSETSGNISDNSVTSAKILDNEVQADDVSFYYALSSSKGGPASSIADNTVTSAKIQNGEVMADDLADGAAIAEILDDDGSGSGLDADMLDGHSSTVYYTPNVAFYAYNSATDAISTSTYTKIEFNEEKFDLSDNYNTTNDEFTAPYNGVYHFSVSIMVDNISVGDYAFVYLYINGSNYSALVYQGIIEDNFYQTYSGSVTVYLNQDDVADIRISTGTDASYSIYGVGTGYYTHFSGHLVSRVHF